MKTVKLCKVADIRTGLAMAPLNEEGKYGAVTALHLTGDGEILYGRKFTDLESDPLRKGDVLFGTLNPKPFAAVVEGLPEKPHSHFGAHLLRIRPWEGEGLDPYLLREFLLTPGACARFSRNTMGVATANRADLAGLDVPVIEDAEHRESLAVLIKSIRDLMHLQRRQRDTMNELLASVVHHELVKGEQQVKKGGGI